VLVKENHKFGFVWQLIAEMHRMLGKMLFKILPLVGKYLKKIS